MKKKLSLKITDMQCPNCAMKLESIEDRLAGVIKAEASYHRATLIIEFFDDQITEESILNEIQRLGYRAIPDA
ncbi:cation transporter [Bellilinea sp.]|jgi:copper chaperone CopZ